MSRHEASNRPRAIQFYRQNSLPTYEEAVANVHHSLYSTNRFDGLAVSSGSVRYNGEADYQYAQAARAQVSDISSRIQNLDACLQDQSSSSVGRMTQTVLEERERAARRQERAKIEHCVGLVAFVILGLTILYCIVQFKFVTK